MINDYDAELMHDQRKEMTRNRTSPIVLIGESESGKHPVTGEVIPGEPIEELTKAVVTEIASAFKTDRDVINGVEVETGDLWVEIDVDDYTTPNDKITELRYDGEDYTVMAADKSGIGKITHVIILGRLTK